MVSEEAPDINLVANVTTNVCKGRVNHHEVGAVAGE